MRVLPKINSMAAVACALLLFTTAAEARPHRAAPAKAATHAAAKSHGAAKVSAKASAKAHAPTRAEKRAAAREAKAAPVKRDRHGRVVAVAAPQENKKMTRAERRAAAREAAAAPVRRDRRGRVIAAVAAKAPRHMTRAEKRAAAREDATARREEKVSGKRGRKGSADADEAPAMHRVRGRAAEPETLPQPLARAVEPAAAPAIPAAPEPVVHHDRKMHHDAPKADSGDGIGPSTPVPTSLPAAQSSIVLLPPPIDGQSTLPATEAMLTPSSGGPALYTKGGHFLMPGPMKGSHEILVRQNQIADLDGLVRVQDDDDLTQMRAAKTLVALPQNEGILTDERLPGNRRYCRPWAAVFLIAMAKAHYAQFHTPLQINSAVRTVAFQQRLMRTNGNAAPAAGETASPHLTGQAVDLAKKGLSAAEIAWMRSYLLPLVQEGKIDVEEEFQQACFHISVYKKYLPPTLERRNVAEGSGKIGMGMAAALR